MSGSPPQWLRTVLEETNGSPAVCLAIARQHLPVAKDAMIVGLTEHGFDLRCTVRNTAATGAAAAGSPPQRATALQKVRVAFPAPVTSEQALRDAMRAIISAATGAPAPSPTAGAGAGAGAGAAAPVSPIATTPVSHSASDTADALSMDAVPQRRATATSSASSPAQWAAAPEPAAAPAPKPVSDEEAAARARAEAPIGFRFTPLFPMPLFIAFGMFVLYLCAYDPPLRCGAVTATAVGEGAGAFAAAGWKQALCALNSVGLFVFRSQYGLHIVFVCACLAHVIEALIALRTALRAKCSPVVTLAWTLQTLAWGFPSLGVLRALVAKRNRARAQAASHAE